MVYLMYAICIAYDLCRLYYLFHINILTRHKYFNFIHYTWRTALLQDLFNFSNAFGTTVSKNKDGPFFNKL